MQEVQPERDLSYENHSNHELRVGHEVKKLNNILCRGFDKDLRKYMDSDATVMHMWILIYLVHQEKQDVFQKDIEKEFKITKSTTTSILKLMEKKDLIARKSVEHDDRLKKICITEKGRSITDAMWNASTRAEKAMVKGIEEDKLKIFFEVMNKISENAEAFHRDI